MFAVKNTPVLRNKNVAGGTPGETNSTSLTSNSPSGMTKTPLTEA
jgi:hypothetical protein